MSSRRMKYDSGEPFREARYSNKHIFSTLIKCAHCGRSFCRKSYTYKNTRNYWKCVTNDQYTAERCDNTVTLEEPELLEQLKNYLAMQIRDKEAFMASVLSGLEQVLPKEDPAAARKELTARREKVIAKRARFQDMYAEDLITMEDLKIKLEKMNRELSSIEDNLAELARAGKLCNSAEELAKQYVAEIDEFLRLENISNIEIRKIIDHILVSKNGEVKVVLKTIQSL